MKANWKTRCRAWVMAAMVGIAGCAASPEPFDYHDDKDEKPGPGLFSGDEGGYVIYGQDADPRQPADAKTAPADAE